MPSIELLNQNGKKVGNLDLADEIFAVEEHQQAVYHRGEQKWAALLHRHRLRCGSERGNRKLRGTFFEHGGRS